MLYEQLFKGLHTHRIRYLVVGAVAVNLHGIPRMTADLDVMVDLEKENVHPDPTKRSMCFSTIQ